MSIPDQNILTELTTAFKTSAENSIGTLTFTSTSMTVKLTIIAYLIYVLLLLAQEDFRNGDILKYLRLSVKEFLKYSSFFFMIYNYKEIINGIIASFFKVGGIAGSNAISASILSSPSTISQAGLDLMLPIWENYITNNIGKILVDLTGFIAGITTGGISSAAIKTVEVIGGAYTQNNAILVMMMMMVITLIVIICFFIMAINIFVIQIEFAIVAIITFVSIPFGVWNKTEFIFHNAKNNIITMGIKYMVLTTILSISMAVIKNIAMPASPTYQQLMYLLLMVIGLTLITIFVPNKIAQEI